jgi:hypothetical protein
LGGVYIDEDDISAEKEAKIQRTWFQKTYTHFIRAGCFKEAQIKGQEATKRLKTADLCGLSSFWLE